MSYAILVEMSSTPMGYPPPRPWRRGPVAPAGAENTPAARWCDFRGCLCGAAPSETECGAPYRRAPIKQSLKRCTLSCPMWLFPSVPSGSSLPTNARHSFSNDDLCAAYEGAANAMRENTSRMVLISNLQGVSALVMSATEAFMPRISIGECEGRHTGPPQQGALGLWEATISG